jgi:hypothetical protein
VALVITDDLEERKASIIKDKRTSAIGTTLTVIANVSPSSLIPSTLMMKAVHSFVTSVLTRDTWRHIQEGGNLHSHRRENLKSYVISNW